MNLLKLFKRRIAIGVSLFFFLVFIISNSLPYRDYLFYATYYIFMVLLTDELLNLNSYTSAINKKVIHLLIHLHFFSFLVLRFFKFDFVSQLTLSYFIAISFGFFVAYLFVIHFFYILNYKNRMKNKYILNDIGYGLMVLFYIIYLIHHICYLREIDFFLSSSLLTFVNPFYLIYLILVSSSYDAGAYILGNFWGKENKLGLIVSPKKSWAGLVGGIFVSCMMILVMHQISLFLNPDAYQKTFLFQIPFSTLIFLTIFLALLAQFGDLTASLHKRVLGVKNSSKLLRGHGGIYDRVDSTVWIVWFGFYVFYFYHLYY